MKCCVSSFVYDLIVLNIYGNTSEPTEGLVTEDELQIETEEGEDLKTE